MGDLRSVRRFHARLLGDRKSTRLNSSHDQISYAVFCLKKKNRTLNRGEDSNLSKITEAAVIWRAFRSRVFCMYPCWRVSSFSFSSTASLFFFFNDTATTEIYTLSLHDALPISSGSFGRRASGCWATPKAAESRCPRSEEHTSELQSRSDLVCRLLLEKKKK